METEKTNHVSNGEEDDRDREQEDEKMEQFFALVRNFREACNRRKHELRSQRAHEEEMKMINKKLKKEKVSHSGRDDDDDDNKQSSWVPSFEWEDFTAEIEFRRPPLVVFPNPYKKKEDKKKQEEKEEEDGLDLNLTLSRAA